LIDFNINTYTDLIKEVLLTEVDSPKFLQILEGLDYAETVELTYSNLPLEASYIQLPIIEGGDILVKIVKLQQAENVALVLPQKVTDAQLALGEDPTLLSFINEDIDLYAEVYGFDKEDPELLKIIKNSYLTLGNRLPAYELTGVQRQVSEEFSEDSGFADELTDDFDVASTGYEDFENADAEAFDAFLQDTRVQTNQEAFKRFTGTKNSYTTLLNKLYTNTPELIRENTKIKMHNNLLVVKMNNHNIYESLKEVPQLAKDLISKAGEIIRKNNDTQLIESLNINNQRFFIIAEANKRNFWKTKQDTLSPLTKHTVYIKPLQKNIIELNTSNVRVEARKYRPALDMNNQLVFIERTFKNVKK
jgi:hypothetical protein